MKLCGRGVNVNGIHHLVFWKMPQTLDEYKYCLGRVARLGNDVKSTVYFEPRVVGVWIVRELLYRRGKMFFRLMDKDSYFKCYHILSSLSQVFISFATYGLYPSQSLSHTLSSLLLLDTVMTVGLTCIYDRSDGS